MTAEERAEVLLLAIGGSATAKEGQARRQAVIATAGRNAEVDAWRVGRVPVNRGRGGDVPDKPTQAAFDAALVAEDVCPKCLGELDTGWECNDCGYDARQHVGEDFDP